MTIDEQSVNTIADRAVYLVLDWSCLGTWKRVETKETTTELRASKRLIKSDVVSDLNKVRNRTRTVLAKYSLSSLFRPGVYVVPLEYIKTVDETLQYESGQLELARKKLVSEWDDIISEARKRLGDLFDPLDYGSGVQASERFSMSYRFIPIASTPDIIKSVAADTYKADLERSRQAAEKELEAFRESLRITLIGIIENMRANLNKPDGERRTFGKRFFKNLHGFMDTFESKNLSDDGELGKVVKQLRDVANGVDDRVLKVSRDEQSALDTTLKGISDCVGNMVIDEGRKIDLSDVA
jgi:hypothetical protein